MQNKSPESIVIVTNQLKNIKSGVGTLANVLITELIKDFDLLIVCPESEKIPIKSKGMTIKTANPMKYDLTSHKWFSFSKQVSKITNNLDPAKYKLILFLDAREGYFANNNIPTLGMIHDFYSARFSKLSRENIRTYPDWYKRVIYFKIMKRLEIKAYGRLSRLVTDSAYA